MDTPTAWLNLTGLRITFTDDTNFPVTSLEPDPLPASAERIVEIKGIAQVNETDVLVIDRQVGLARQLPLPAPGVGLVVLGSVADSASFTRVDLWEPYDVLPSGPDGGINCRGLVRRRLA